MRYTLIGLATAALVFVTYVSAGVGPQEAGPKAMLYMDYGFGGTEHAPNSFRYGLQLDYDRPLLNQDKTPLVQFQFSNNAFDSLALNGVPLFTRDYLLRQNDEEAGIGSFVKDNLGPIILGVIGVGVIAAAAGSDSDDRDAGDIEGQGSPEDFPEGDDIEGTGDDDAEPALLGGTTLLLPALPARTGSNTGGYGYIPNRD